MTVIMVSSHNNKKTPLKRAVKTLEGSAGEDCIKIK